MNRNGQVLALFAILLPLILMTTTFIIDTGLLYMEKRHVDFVVKDTTEYGMKNISSVTEQELYNLLQKNLDDISDVEIVVNNGVLKISVLLEKESVFATFLGKERYEIKSTYKGMIEQDSIRIVRG